MTLGSGIAARIPAGWRVFAVAALLFGALGGVWALSTPLFAAPDEPAHAIRAVATWSGDRGGERVDVDGLRSTRYRVPSPYDVAGDIAACSAYQTDLAPCGPEFRPTGEEVTATSTAGYYPPLFYVAVGWAGALWEGSAGMYAMRLVHVAMCAVLVGLAAVCTSRHRPGGLAMCGLVLAVTPMVVFLSGTVNSSGLEVSASIALWAALLSLLRAGPATEPADAGDADDADGWATPRWFDATVALVSGVVLVSTRTFSPGFAAVICGIALVASPGVTPRRVLARRDVSIVLAALAVVATAAVLLVARSGQFDGAASGGVELGSGDTALSFGLGYQEVGFRQMVAWFGWLDTGTAQLSYYAWVVGCATLVVGAIVAGRWRRLLGVALALGATVVLPIASNLGQAQEAGFVWQGRYSLPFAVGVPILAALALAESPVPAALRRRLVALVGVLAAVGQTYAVYWALRRFSVGLRGDLIFFSDPAWAPPLLGSFGTVAAATAVSATMAVVLARTASRSATSAATGPIPPRPIARSSATNGGATHDDARTEPEGTRT